MIRLSFSAISQWQKCKLAYKLHYLDRIVETKNPALELGLAVHQTLEVIVDERLDPRRGIDHWRQRSSRLDETAQAQGADMVTGFLARYAPDHEVLGIEKKFELVLGDGAVKLVGFIDRIDRKDNDLYVIDYKTNRSLYSAKGLAESLQLGIYHLAARQLWPEADRIYLQYHMLRHDVIQTTERTPEQDAQLRQEIVDLGKEIQSEKEYPAHPSKLCAWCGYAYLCYAFPQHAGKVLLDGWEVAK